MWHDFLDFLRTFDRAVTVIRTAEDYRDITFEYLQACAAEGAIYVEVTVSPDHADQAGLGYADMLAGVAQGIDDARAASGIESRMIVTAVRNFGVERAEWVARTAAAQPHPYVTGFGLAGDEAGFPPGPFGRAFAIAHDAGLGITCHAGEWVGPESVRGALALPVPVTRLGHGVRAIEDPALVAELAERGTVLEVCPTSNVVLDAYPSYAAHPFPACATPGCGSRSARTTRRTGARPSAASTRWPGASGGWTTLRCATSPRRPFDAAFVPERAPKRALSAKSAMSCRAFH